MNNDDRINALIEMIGGMASLDFSKQALTNNSNDYLDIIGKGLNMLSEELEENVVEKTSLEMKVKELEQFSYVISHDLKAPLRRINFISHLLEDSLAKNTTEEVRTYLDSLKSLTIQMEKLINEILEYSRIGMGSVAYENTDVVKLIEEVVKTIVIPQNYTVKIQPNIPPINIKRVLMFQVFSNLIINSIKYNDKEKGRTEITYKDLGNYHEFSVSDNGKGIEERHHHKIFELFRTLQDEPETDSSGIGLPIVKKIIEMEKGKIRVASKVGKGSTFTFFIQKIED